jgi:o-succinylbenzoate synthase
MRIVAVDYRVVRWPIAPRGAARDRWTERTAVIVAVRSDAGTTGLGEAAPLPEMSIDTVDDTLAACEALSSRLPITLEVPSHATAIADRITPAPAARFAIETALLSALAQHTRTSVASLMTAMPHAELRNNVVVDDEDEALAAVARGAPCLKIKAPVPADLDRVRRIARAVGERSPITRLRIDANRGWPRAQVRTLLASLAHLPVDYVEEPCVDAHRLLAEPLLARIALDESLVELAPADLARALGSPHLGAVVLKPTLLGGFARCLELATQAHTHGVAPVVTHALEGAVGTAACRELARAIGADVPVGLAPHEGELGFRSHRGSDAFDRAAASTGLPNHMQLSCISSGEAEERARSATSVATHIDPTLGTGVGPHFAAPSEAQVTTIVATHTHQTVEAIRASFAERQRIALLHAKLPADELARLRASIDAARFVHDDAMVLFTSGSTGPARGVVLSRRALLANAEASAARLGWRDDDRWLCCLPLAHAGGLSTVIRCAIADKPIVLGDVTAIGEATIASLVPAQLAQLLADPDWRPLPKLRAVLLGGAAAPPSLLDAAMARGVPVLTTYGLTETFGQVATARVPGGKPVPLPGVELTAGTREAPAPIRIRGPMLATRYLDGAPIAPELVTADLGFLDGDVLHVVGRADDVIISGGENVHPAQVEAVLAATQGVRAAAAFGVADPQWGQLVAVAISVAPSFDRERAFAAWHAQLPPHARPRRLATLAELPLLPSGKLDRRRLTATETVPIDYACYKPRA